jgi:hypothetical protein
MKLWILVDLADENLINQSSNLMDISHFSFSLPGFGSSHQIMF